MNQTNLTVRIYYAPLSYPCGPQSSCCGPTGQSDEELRGYISELESKVPGVSVQTVDATGGTETEEGESVRKLLQSFGVASCPIFAVDGEVVSMGPPSIAELVELVRSRVAAVSTPAEEKVEARRG